MTGRAVQTFFCAHCAKPFGVPPSRRRHGRGLHCSAACQYAAKRAAPKTLIEITCLGCSKAFRRFPSQLDRKGGGKFCTRECRDKNRVGSLSPNWRNAGGVYKRGPHWHAIRRRILARDKCCQHCSETRGLHVHHIIPFRMWSSADDANQETNLVALCPPCHRREDARHFWMTPSKVEPCQERTL